MILRQRIHGAVVVTCEQVGDALIVIRKINVIIRSDIVIQIQENIILHVHLGDIGMHPENIRHTGLIGSAGLEQGPVVVPVNNINLNLDAGLCSPLVRDLLNAGQLVVIPDRDLQLVHFIRSRAEAHSCSHANQHGSCTDQSNTFSHILPPWCK